LLAGSRSSSVESKFTRHLEKIQDRLVLYLAGHFSC
jgi:hypothetical protein